MDGLRVRRQTISVPAAVLMGVIVSGLALVSLSSWACPPATTYTLEVIVQPEEAGYVQLDPGGGEYSSGEQVTLTAFLGQLPENYVFCQWLCEGETWHESSSTAVRIEMNSDKVVTAVYKLYIDMSREGDGTAMPAPGRHLYDKGDEVNLEAVPDEGWEFYHWFFEPVGEPASAFYVTENPGRIFLSRSQRASTVFEPMKHLTVDIAPPASGSVALDPDGGLYCRDTIVNLRVSPEAGNVFVEWQGDLAGPSLWQSICMDDDHSVTAVFDASYTLALGTVPAYGTIETSPDARCRRFRQNSSVELAAKSSADISRPGLIFDHWSGDLQGTANPATLLMDSNKSVTAYFREGAVLAITEGAHLVTRSPSPAFGDVYEYGTQVVLSVDFEPGPDDVIAWFVDDINYGAHESIVLNMDRNYSVRLATGFPVPFPPDYVPTAFLSMHYTGEGEVLPQSGWQSWWFTGVPTNLLAIPAEGWALREWDVVESYEGIVSRDNPHMLSLNDWSCFDCNFSVCAHFERGFSLATTVYPDDSMCRVDYCPDPPGGVQPGESTAHRIETYIPGDIVTLEAWQDGDLAFTQWLEDGQHFNSSPILTVAMERDYDLTAAFEQGTRVTTHIAYDYNPVADVESPPSFQWEDGQPGEIVYMPDWPGGVDDGYSRCEVYLPGTTVELLPEAMDGFAFSRWLEGDEYGPNLNSGPLYTAVVGNQDLEVTAVFKPGWIVDAWVFYDNEPANDAGEIIFQPNYPGGQTLEAFKRETYLDQSVITLTAEANVGYVFSEWKRGAAGVLHNEPSHTFVVRDYHFQDENALQAHFTSGNVLTLTVSPREDCGEVVFEPDLPGGAEDGCERQETYLPDASVTFTALSAEGYHFVQWLCPGNPSDPIHGSPNTQQTTLMANDKAYVAEFAADTPVQLVVSASGNGTVSPASGGYAQNQQITLKATPAEDSQFLYWEQVNPPGLEIAEACITITMDQDRELRAVFIAREYHSLTINTVSMSPGATGWVARVPAGTGMPPQYVTNTYVHLAAQPEGTTALRHWDGPVQMSVEDDPVQKLQDPHQIVLMDADKTITAYFDITYGLVLHAVHAELGAVHCPTQPVRGLFRYWPGTEVQIEAHPRENARFDHWEIEGQHAGSDNPHTHVITGDVSVEGFFMEQFDLSLEQPGNGAYIYVADAVPPPVEGRFDAGTQITLAYQNPPAGTWRMDHWEIDGEDVGAENTITFTITDDSRATVHLVPNRRITSRIWLRAGLGAVFRDGHGRFRRIGAVHKTLIRARSVIRGESGGFRGGADTAVAFRTWRAVLLLCEGGAERG